MQDSAAAAIHPSTIQNVFGIALFEVSAIGDNLFLQMIKTQ